MTRPLWLAALVPLALAACAGGTADTEQATSPEPAPRPALATPAPAPPPPAPPPPVAADAGAPSAPALTVPDAICAELRAAPALALAVVRSSAADCSSVGHTRTVLDVVRLARGTGISVVSHSHLLYGKDAPRFAAGDHAVVAITPGALPATAEMCVPMPRRDGTVTRAVHVDSAGVGHRLLEAILHGAPCATP